MVISSYMELSNTQIPHTKIPDTNQTSIYFKYGSALLAFILWGSWAYFVNTTANHSGLFSGLAQGSASFVITLFMVQGVTYLFSLFNHPAIQLLLPALMTSMVTILCLVIIHYLIGTQEILLTILPASTIGFIFCLYTSYKLYRQTPSNQYKNKD